MTQPMLEKHGMLDPASFPALIELLQLLNYYLEEQQIKCSSISARG